jgi:hypothetical protein
MPHPLRPLQLLPFLLTTGLLAMQPAAAQAPAPAAPAAPATPAAATAKPAPPRPRIELPAERQKAQDASAPPRTNAAPVTADDLVPSELDAKAPPPPEEPVTRIEQSRTVDGNREVRVTPALTGRPYTMIQRDGQIPRSATGSGTGLSVPRFFTFEWGRSDEPRSPAPPPPSTSSPR